MPPGDEMAFLTFLWQHESKTGKWTNYSEEEQVHVNKAFNKNQKSVTLPSDDPKKKIWINFETMIQKNRVSGFEKRVRCAIFKENFYVWQWKNDEGFYNSFTPAVALVLETAYQKKDLKVKFYYKGDYEVDFGTLKQRNEESNALRDVQREQIDVTITNGTLSTISVDSAIHIAKLCKEKTDSSDRAKRIKLDLNQSSSQDVLLPLTCSTSNGRKIVSNTKIPIDSVCPEYGKSHIYCEGDMIYDVMLNQTSLQNNNNKFFIIQLLESNKGSKYCVWFRWGRVGLKGQNNLIQFNTNLDDAKITFEKKFYDKTKNEWHDSGNFCKVLGKYDLVKIDRTPAAKEVKRDVQTPSSKLHVKILELLEIICDKKNMEDIMKEMEYDSKKTPLGRLTMEQINAGYTALNKIANVLNSGGRGGELLHACNEFYTRIPHSFGMKTPPVIHSMSDVRVKIKMLEALSQIHVAMNVMSVENINDEHPLDKYYKSLECDLRVLDPDYTTFQTIQKCLINTQAPSHQNYELRLLNVFEIHKVPEDDNFIDYGNRKLLWHGSRLSNWIGILKKGLQIAPTEAPVSGYMFGKGIYFADMSSKSANYCFATKSKNEGLLLLCEVSLGNTKEEYFSNYSASKLPKGYHSVKGVGKVRPRAEEDEILGVKIPVGKWEFNPESLVDSGKFSLNYNEYIVYDIRQVKMKYLVHVQFLYK